MKGAASARTGGPDRSLPLPLARARLLALVGCALAVACSRGVAGPAASPATHAASPATPAASPAPSAASPAPSAASLPACAQVVPLARDTNLFTVVGQVAPTTPYLRIVEPVPPAIPGFDPAADPDGLAIVDVTVPVPPPAAGCGDPRALTLYTAAQSGLDVDGIAADGTIVYDDGSTQPLKWMVGEQAWPAWAGATGRGAAVVDLGANASGDRVTASALTVPIAPPDGRAAVKALRLKARGGLPLVLLGAVLSPTPPEADAVVYTRADLTPFRWSGFLDQPLTAPLPPEPGPVQVRDGHLAWADGRAARFWGVNLVGEAALPAADVAEPFARQLASLGFNLVRLHHIDTDTALANPRRGQPREGGGIEPLTNAEALDRMDRFTAALGKAGVYQYLELMTLHSFRVAEGVHAPADVPVNNKYVGHFQADWEAAQEAWARAVWARVNPYTGLRYGEDPHVAVVELENENSLVSGWAGGALERLPEAHQRDLDVLWRDWLRRTYGTDAKIEAAWRGSIHPGLGDTELLDVATIRREPSQRARVDQWPLQRAVDLVRFYAELEAAHQANLAAFVRSDLGFQGPLVCNTSFGVPQADALMAACDVIDLHVYWDGIYETNAFFEGSLLRKPEAGRFLERLGACQADKPCTISELQHTFPSRRTQEAPYVWSALASRQDLDAVVWFAWSHAAVRAAPDGPVGALDLEGRWGALMQLPGAAWLYRSGAVAAAADTFTRWWSPDGLARDLAEQPGVFLSELLDPSSLLGRQVRASFAPRPPASAAGGGGPDGGVRWDPAATGAPFTIDTPAVRAVLGGSGRAGDLSVQVRGPALPGSADPAVSLERHDNWGRLVVASATIRAGTVFPRNGYGTRVAGQGEAGLAPVQVEVTFDWPRRPVFTPEPGTSGVPAVSPAGRGRWSVQVPNAGWWRIE